jgi:hypothetical protein
MPRAEQTIGSRAENMRKYILLAGLSRCFVNELANAVEERNAPEIPSPTLALGYASEVEAQCELHAPGGSQQAAGDTQVAVRQT